MIELNDVRAGYGGTEILHGISFSLEKGENLSIIGCNGSGKTTLLRAIAGTIPFSGEIRINNQSIRQTKPKYRAKKVALFSQITQLYFSYSVFDTVMMGRFAHAPSGLFNGITKTDKKLVCEAIKTVGLEKFIDCTIDTLSGGQLQRVFLAKIFVQNPDVILLDEPTNHLDLTYQIELINFLKNWSKDGNKAVVGVLHDLNLALALSDNVLLLENGTVRLFGKNEEVYASEDLATVFQMDIGAYMIQTLGQWQKLLGSDVGNE